MRKLVPALLFLLASPCFAQTSTQLIVYLTWSSGAPVQATLTLKDGTGSVLATAKTCCSTGWASVTETLDPKQVYIVSIHAATTATTPALDYEAPFTTAFLPSNVAVSRAELHATFSTSLPIKVTAWKLITAGTA